MAEYELTKKERETELDYALTCLALSAIIRCLNSAPIGAVDIILDLLIKRQKKAEATRLELFRGIRIRLGYNTPQDMTIDRERGVLIVVENR